MKKYLVISIVAMFMNNLVAMDRLTQKQIEEYEKVTQPREEKYITGMIRDERKILAKLSIQDQKELNKALDWSRMLIQGGGTLNYNQLYTLANDARNILNKFRWSVSISSEGRQALRVRYTIMTEMQNELGLICFGKQPLASIDQNRGKENKKPENKKLIALSFSKKSKNYSLNRKKTSPVITNRSKK